MKLFPFKKRSTPALTAEEKAEAKQLETATEPDMLEQVVKVDDEIETPEGEISENMVVTESEPGILQTDNLVKKYGKRTVANHVSINVRQGEIVGLLGPNGAGKTTTFYMTTGLITPNEGKIYLNNIDITGYPVYKRAQLGIGYLAQEASVFRKLSVEDNIRAVLEMTPTTKEYQKEKLESLIAEFRLGKVRKKSGRPIVGWRTPTHRNSKVSGNKP